MTKNNVNKWQHDGIEANETWWYGPAGADVGDGTALGTVSPFWNPTRCHGRGKPDAWRALDANGKDLGRAPTRRQATQIVECSLAPFGVGTDVVQISDKRRERGTVVAVDLTSYDVPMCRVVFEGRPGIATLTPSEIEACE